MGAFYGHSHLIALRAAEGFLCYRWLFGPYASVILFTDAKAAKEWMKKAADFKWKIEAIPTMVSSHPPELQAAINPPFDFSDLARIMSHRFYQNWQLLFWSIVAIMAMRREVSKQSAKLRKMARYHPSPFR